MWLNVTINIRYTYTCHKNYVKIILSYTKWDNMVVIPASLNNFWICPCLNLETLDFYHMIANKKGQI